MSSTPASTYDDRLASTRDLVRFLSGDTGRDGTWWLSDAELDWIISATSGAYMAAADALDAMSVRAAQRADGATGDESQTWSTVSERFERLARTRRQQSGSAGVPGEVPGSAAPVLGGADIPRAFWSSQFSNPPGVRPE